MGELNDRVERVERDLQELKRSSGEDLYEGLDLVWDELRGEMRGGFQELRESFDGLQHSFGGVKDDLGMIKGAHARNEALRKPTRIANDLGYQFIYQLSEGALLEFGKRAAAQGKGEVESFVNADLVMMVQDDRFQPHYLAVEASFSVDAEDIRRATRNASYLEEFTNIPSVPVVAGVELLQDVDHNGVRWYRIPKRDIQPA